MARPVLIIRAVGFVLVALGLVALTAGPSIVDMSAIRFVRGITAAPADVTGEPTGGPVTLDVSARSVADILESPTDSLFTSAPPMPPRRAIVRDRSMVLALLVLLAALATLVGAQAPCQARRRLAALAVRRSGRSGALRRLRRRAPPRLLV
jgi:hypothetical protein